MNKLRNLDSRGHGQKYHFICPYCELQLLTSLPVYLSVSALKGATLSFLSWPTTDDVFVPPGWWDPPLIRNIFVLHCIRIGMGMVFDSLHHIYSCVVQRLERSTLYLCCLLWPGTQAAFHTHCSEALRQSRSQDVPYMLILWCELIYVA